MCRQCVNVAEGDTTTSSSSSEIEASTPIDRKMVSTFSDALEAGKRQQELKLIQMEQQMLKHLDHEKQERKQQQEESAKQFNAIMEAMLAMQV